MGEYLYNYYRIHLGHRAQLALTLVAIGAILWAALFSEIEPAHSLFHNARHSIGILACH